MALAIGHRLGPYEIASALGTGGMGEVYRARDTRLGREVALKILPDAFALDDDRRARFRREAQLLASLHHPHIATLFGFEEFGAARVLSMELVEGPTLAETLAAGGALDAGEARRLAAQITSALEAAHDKGIVHRDLKPANIKVTLAGAIKLLDFGLAKALGGGSEPEGSQSPTVTDAGTRAGVVLGTVAYMSPEQARGLAVDERTDIWSLGCVLFELLTGRAPFEGQTLADVTSAILSRQPDWTLLPAGLAVRMRHVLSRCLSKEAKNRFRSVVDVRFALEDLDAAVEPALPPRVPAGGLILPWLVAAIAVVVAVVLWRGTRNVGPSSPSETFTAEQLTYDTGLTTMPAVSRDGRLLAYASDRAGRGDLDIWVQLADGEPLRLTDDPGDDESPDFSPDGSQIIYRSSRQGGGVFIVPTLGGTPPRLLAQGGWRPRFSPDGTHLTYWVGQIRGASTARSQVFVLPLSGGTPTQLLSGFATARDPIWAPDGRALLVAGMQQTGTAALQTGTSTDLDWWWVPVDGSHPQKTGAAALPAVRRALNQAGQSPATGQWTSNGVVFSDGRDLWRLPLDPRSGRVSGSIERLTAGAEQYHHPSVAGSGTIMFAATSILRVIERSALGDDAPPPIRLYEDERSTSGRGSQSRDGSLLIITGPVLRGQAIWLIDTRTKRRTTLTTLRTTENINATISPDGARVAYSVSRVGYSLETADGVPREVCQRCGVFGFLSDSRRVLAIDDVSRAIRLIDVLSGRIDDVLNGADGRFSRPHASPDDRLIAFTRNEGLDNINFVAPLQPGRPPAPDTWRRVDESTGSGRPAGWSSDSRTLYLLLDTDGFRCLWGQMVDGQGRLVDKPFGARHFHGANDSTFGSTLGNAITDEGFLSEGSRRRANLWALAPARPSAPPDER